MNRLFIIFAFCSGILLIGCDDPRNKTEGTVHAVATYSVADEALENAKLVLGEAYFGLCSARSSTEFDAHCSLLNAQQLEAVMTIQRQLGSCISVIEKEPSTRAAALADSVVQQNQGFLIGLPRLQQNWLSARQRIPRE